MKVTYEPTMEGKICMVTGATAGIGQATALRLAAAWRPADGQGADPAEPGPPPAHQTATLLEEASRQLGFRPRKTMALAQRLYEGVVLDDGERTGLLTYPRTGSTWIAAEVDRAVRALVLARHGPAALAPVLDRRGALEPQGAHQALRPARLDWPPERARQALREAGGRDLPRLYELTWDRLLGSRMAVEAWRALAARRREADSRRGAPPRLDDAALLELLVQQGIGRPSTLATVGESLETRGYLARCAGALQVTPLGERVAAWLDRTFPRTLDAAYTTSLEARLDAVEAGSLPWRAAVAEAWAPLERALGQVVA